MPESNNHSKSITAEPQINKRKTAIDVEHACDLPVLAKAFEAMLFYCSIYNALVLFEQIRCED